MTDNLPVCLYCQKDSDTVPLIQIRYRGQDRWICPQHLPILIHKPAALAQVLPGVENIKGATHED